MEKYPNIFELHGLFKAQAVLPMFPWDAALAAADEHGRALLVELRRRLDATNGTARLVQAGNSFHLEADQEWLAQHGEDWLDLTALVHVQGARPLQLYLLPAMDEEIPR